MSIRILLKCIVFVGIFFALSCTAFANLEITEIMYNPKGANDNHQWIEVYNNGQEDISIDASKWRFNDGSSHYMNDKVDFSVPAGSFFILTGDKNTFISDHSGFSGLVIDTTMELKVKDGSTVSIFNGGTSPVDSVIYNSSQGGSEDGNSLQKINNAWVPAIPTPGLSNQSNSDNSNNNGLAVNNSSSDTQSSNTQAPKKETEVPKITTEIISKNLIFSNISFPIDSITLGYSKENLTHGKFVWNFGDGVTKEETDSKPFEYLYSYPGEYVVTLSYYQNYYKTLPDATDRMIIKVVPSEITISSVGDSVDSFIELENKSAYEIPLSKWIIKGLNNSFIIPEGTVILPNKKLKLSPKVTNLNSEDIQSIILQNPSGDISANYPVIPINAHPFKIISANNFKNYTPDTITNNTKSDISLDKSQTIDLNNLGASAVNTDTKNTSGILSFMGLGGIIILGVASVFVIRRKNNIPDYVEQNLRAEDMTIME